MQRLANLLKHINGSSFSILDAEILPQSYTPIDLSVHNSELEHVTLSQPEECQTYIDGILKNENALVGYGGYLEKRNLYGNNPNFFTEGWPSRDIHLGIDFWSIAGTKVLVPIDGTVHSFKNNAIEGDYGPTIILQHVLNGFHFHTLYGHLSLESLENLYVGKNFRKGDVVGRLGSTAINVNYAPHLHFQIIIDMADKKGDYPGVCSEEDLEFYAKNCPDPNLLLKM